VIVALFHFFCTSDTGESHAKALDARYPSSEKSPVRIPYKIIKLYPHAADAFTQGLFHKDGYLYESIGQYGRSSLRKVKLETGDILQEVKLPGNVFGEGIAPYKDTVIQLTWFAHIAFVYNADNLELIDRVDIPQRLEGWGLTFDGIHLIMSDGTANLYYLHPSSLKIERTITVHTQKGPLRKINELEYYKKRVLANVWQSNNIVIIDPETGEVTSYLDLSALEPKKFHKHPDHVLNGIAFNPKNGHIYVTGKMWPNLYELELMRWK
jgi:glutamine cyclotransferase